MQKGQIVSIVDAPLGTGYYQIEINGKVIENWKRIEITIEQPGQVHYKLEQYIPVTVEAGAFWEQCPTADQGACERKEPIMEECQLEKKIINALAEWVLKVAQSIKTTPEEVVALADVAKVVLDQSVVLLNK